MAQILPRTQAGSRLPRRGGPKRSSGGSRGTRRRRPCGSTCCVTPAPSSARAKCSAADRRRSAGRGSPAGAPSRAQSPEDGGANCARACLPGRPERERQRGADAALKRQHLRHLEKRSAEKRMVWPGICRGSRAPGRPSRARCVAAIEQSARQDREPAHCGQSLPTPRVPSSAGVARRRPPRPGHLPTSATHARLISACPARIASRWGSPNEGRAVERARSPVEASGPVENHAQILAACGKWSGGVARRSRIATERARCLTASSGQPQALR